MFRRARAFIAFVTRVTSDVPKLNEIEYMYAIDLKNFVYYIGLIGP